VDIGDGCAVLVAESIVHEVGFGFVDGKGGEVSLIDHKEVFLETGVAGRV